MAKKLLFADNVTALRSITALTYSDGRDQAVAEIKRIYIMVRSSKIII